MYSEELLEELKGIVRVKSHEADIEIEGLIGACMGELKIAGVHGDTEDPLCRQAIRLYCKAHYGYDKDTERFREAFNSLRDSMALSGDYAKKESL